MNWSLVIVQFVGGCGLLAFAADRFIVSSAIIARRLNMPTLLVGMLLVGFGTSFPEIVVSAIAAWHHTPQLAIGNAIGSNIINTSLVLGTAALIAPLVVHSRLLKREFPIMLAASVLVFILLANHTLSRLDGVILLIALFAHLFWMIYSASRAQGQGDAIEAEFQEDLPKNGMRTWVAVVWWFTGLALLFVSSELLVSGAVAIAKWLQVSDLIIGLTIVAVGTSLPELAATVMSALRNEHDIALGNVIGSNIFNLLAVLAMPALIFPSKISASLTWRDYPVMVGFMLLMWVLAFFPRQSPKLGRLGGLILVLGFFVYLTWLVVPLL